MRIRRLNLDSFGHFSGKAFDFGEPDANPDFHIIYGPNEAGKTTTMEAFLRLLYGFDAKERYGFLHQRKNLQIRGALDFDGVIKEFTRLPSRNPSLVDPSGNAVPESALQAHLGGLSQEDYRKLLCLDDDTIEKGGDEIANSKGDIGRLLFSAAAGIGNLTEVLDQVQSEADAMYRKKSSKTEMAALKRQLAEVTTQINAQDISASVWKKLKQTARLAEEQEATLREERDALRRQEAGIRAQQSALPLLAEIHTLEGKIAPYQDYPERLELQPEDLVALLTEQTAATRDAERLQGEISGLEDQISTLSLQPLHVDLAQALDDLDLSRSRFQSADRDLDRRQTQHDELVTDMARVARDLAIPADADLQLLVISAATISQLEAALEARKAVAAAHSKERAEVEALTQRLEQAQIAVADLSAANGPDADIGGILARFSVDTLAPAHAAACQKLLSAEAQLRETLEALTIRGSAFDSLPDCAVTLEEAKALEAKHAQVQQDLARIGDKLREIQDDMAVNAARISTLRSQQNVVGDVETDAMRAKRDALWAAHRASLDDQSAQTFEHAMHALDTVNETRIANANELAELRRCDLALKEVEARSQRTVEHLAELQAQETAVLDRVADLAKASGLKGMFSASELVDWVGRHQTAASAQTALSRVRHEVGADLERAAEVSEALRSHFDLHDPDFDALVAAARTRALAEQTQREAMRQAQLELERFERDLATRSEALQSLGLAVDQKVQAWEAIVSQTFDDTIATATLEASLEPLRRLRELDAERSGIARQISGMQADQAQFTDAIQTLADAHDIPMAAPMAAFDALRQLSSRAVEAQAQFDDLGEQLSKKSGALANARASLGDIDVKVATLAELFPASASASTLEGLRAATVVAQDVIEARARMAGLVTKLLTVLSLPTLSDAKSALGHVVAADLDAGARSLEADLEDLEARLSTAIEERTTANHELKAVTGDADVARLVEQRTTLELQIEDVALSWLQLRAGQKLAEEAIRRYRDTHRSGMMTATEQAFSELTNGAYVRLRTQPDGANEVLQAIDADGRAKMAQDMSKGTRFQLYLALRAAAHAQLIDQGVRLPFFCDDIFETFDEDRTRSACRVMERIGQSGQAIYLTHHRHVVDIAREVCSVPPRVHELVEG